MEFYYRAITKEGERVTGHHKARTYSAARRELAEMFSSVLEVSEVDSKKLAKLNKPFKVKQEAVAIFFRRMATMLNSGVPLADALHFMVTSEADDALARASSASEVTMKCSASARGTPELSMVAMRRKKMATASCLTLKGLLSLASFFESTSLTSSTLENISANSRRAAE